MWNKVTVKRLNIVILFLAVWLGGYAADYRGRVVDNRGQGIGYATVYPVAEPIAGTATNNDGYFSFSADLPASSDVVVSFIGYAKQVVPLGVLTDSTATIVLREQPIALEEMVVAAKPSRQRNKRKAMAALLHKVYVRMLDDFGGGNAKYRIVSDVRMDAEGEPWGMEQMVATIVVLPEAAQSGMDSVQFRGDYCKRYFAPEIRQLADTILAGNTLEKMDKKNNLRKAVNAVDSGVVTHKALFAIGNIRQDFEKSMSDLKHWSVSNESEHETVLTHVEKKNIFGIYKHAFYRNYIVDSDTYEVLRFSERAEFAVNIPFGYKLNKDQLQLLNLLNMSDGEITKFRLRKARAVITLNTIYQKRDGHLYIQEKNLHTDAHILGTKKMEIPVQLWATQRVITMEKDGIKPMKRWEMNNRVRREIVPIY